MIADSVSGEPIPGVISTSLDGEAGPGVGQDGRQPGGRRVQGKANVAIFTITDYPILNIFTDASPRR